MAWEREYHHLNLDEATHEIGLIERSVQTRDGQPSRYQLQFVLGGTEFETTFGASSLRVSLGGELSIQEDGTLKDSSGNVFDPKAFEREMINRLNDHHAKLRRYAQKHGILEFKKK
jgi:hypothetical protein